MMRPVKDVAGGWWLRSDGGGEEIRDKFMWENRDENPTALPANFYALAHMGDGLG